MWRGWLKNGQSLELNWQNRFWEFGAGILIHINDDDMGDRMLCLKFWRVSAYIPIGIVPHPWPTLDRRWSVFASNDFGLAFCWGLCRKSLDWPWSLHTLEYQMQMPDGSWCDVFDRSAEPHSESYTYTYTLKSGTIQNRTATVSKRRHILCRRIFRRLRWPRWAKESLEIEFSDEVGERSGSWKGGTIGCGYDLLPGETMLDSLRRMERERVFR